MLKDHIIREGSDPVSVILLAHNEARTIEREIRAFNEVVVSRLKGSEFIVAEDGSTDGTTEILERIHREGMIYHLTSPERRGYRQALLDAVSHCKNNFIFLSDTGLKHDPGDFWNLYPLRHRFDLVVGRKTNRQDQRYRQMLTYGYNLVIRILFGNNQIYDCDSGFKLFNRAVTDNIFKSENLFFKELANSEIVLRVLHEGLRYAEVPVTYRQREGVSRGLPPQKLFRVIVGSLVNLVKLKQEFHG